MPRHPAVAVEYSHHTSEGVCQGFILADTATPTAHVTALASQLKSAPAPMSGNGGAVEGWLFEELS
jgi:hypothetical protein